MREKKQQPVPEPQQPKPVNPVIAIAKKVLGVLSNKMVASLMLFAQGILFLAAPSGDMSGTIRIAGGIIILASVIIIVFHLKREKVTLWDKIVAVFFGLLIPAAGFFIWKPDIIEPYVKIVVGAVTILTSVINLVETLKIKKKKDWKFIVSVAGAVVLMALGVFMIVADENQIAVAQRSAGAFLILNALANIWYMVQRYQEKKEQKKKAKAEGKA